MNRQLATLCLLVVLSTLAGCTGLFGPGDIGSDRLNENATYDWESNATVDITLNGSSYGSVYDVSNRSELSVYRRDALRGDQNLQISALRYRFPNGSVVTIPSENVSLSDERTTITMPNVTGGRLAFTVPRQGKQFTTPVYVEGSYDLTLPPGARVGILFLSQVSPGGYDTSLENGRMTLHWDNVTRRAVNVRFYLQRDVYLFGGVVVVATVLGGAGALYYYRQIQRLVRRREEAGIDLEEDEGDDDDFPGP